MDPKATFAFPSRPPITSVSGIARAPVPTTALGPVMLIGEILGANPNPSTLREIRVSLLAVTPHAQIGLRLVARKTLELA